jgi:sortase A
MRRLLRVAGSLLIVAGLLMLVWAFVVWRWEDPFTRVYTALEQRRLESSYEDRLAEYVRDAPPVTGASGGMERTTPVVPVTWLRAAARRYRSASGRGDALGHLRIPRLQVDMVLVNGTDSRSLKRGPGRYAGLPGDIDVVGDRPKSYMPGEGHLVYVAGHRTTYSAPFANIDDLERGDRVVVEMPYATFEYRVTRHEVVRDDVLRVLDSRGREVLALQACHPRFFASQRYIVYATPVRVTTSGGGVVPTAGLAAGRRSS